MYGFNTFAYTHLQFLPPNCLFTLARSVHRLAEVLARSPHYAQAVRTMRIIGWNAINVPDGYDQGMVYKALDGGVMTILANAPHIHSLTLDLSLTEAIHCFPQTSATLTRVRTIRNLRLATFSPPAYERVSLRVSSGAQLPVTMQDLRNLRWFGFTVLDEAWNPADTNWAMTLHSVTEGATELKSLVLEKGGHFDTVALGQMLQSGFVRVPETVPPFRQLMMV